MHSGFPDPRHIVKLSGVSFAVTEFISGLQNAVLSTMHLPFPAAQDVSPPWVFPQIIA